MNWAFRDVLDERVPEIFFDLRKEGSRFAGCPISLGSLSECQDCLWPIEMTFPVLAFHLGNLARGDVFARGFAGTSEQTSLANWPNCSSIMPYPFTPIELK